MGRRIPPRRPAPAVAVAALAAVALVVVAATSGCARDDRRDDSAPTTTIPTSSTATSSTATTTSSTAVPSSTAPADCAGDGVASRRTASYREGTAGDLNTLEVIQPARESGCAPSPVMVWVHGGGWSIGDRRNQLDDKVELFTSQGWTLVSVNYRLSPAVQYPVHDDDVAAAIGWVIDHADELGIDPARVSVMGHSAGAGIAAAVATNPAHLAAAGHELADLRCAVLLDTEGYDVEKMAAEGVDIYRDAFGDDPAVWREASPMRNVAEGRGIPRSMVVTRGTEGRRATASAFVEALRDAGVETSLVDARPLSHAEVNQAVGAPGDERVTPPLLEFLEDC